jgi:hypothetical protein
MPSFATSAGCCAARFADVDSASGLFLIFAAELAADYSRQRPRATSHSAGLPARAASSAVIIRVTLRRETPVDGSTSMAETCKWLRHAGNGSDSLAQDSSRAFRGVGGLRYIPGVQSPLPDTCIGTNHAGGTAPASPPRTTGSG